MSSWALYNLINDMGANMEIPKDQLAFDTVVVHLTTQKERSVNPETNLCMYRGPGGTKCAVGALIPDEQFNPAWEFNSVFDIYSSIPALQCMDMELLWELQHIHDNPENWGPHGFHAWNTLKMFAARYNLSFSGGSK